MSYNGFTNYETWNIALWLNNDETLYHTVKELLSNGGTDYEHAEALKQFIADNAPELGASCYSDLLGAALSAVDWYEVLKAVQDE